MTIGLNDIIKATGRLRWDAQLDVQNVFHYLVENMGTATNLQVREGIAAMVSNIYNEINSILPPEFTYSEINLFNVTDNVPEPDEAFVDLTAGEGSNLTLPPACSIFMYGRTAFTGVRGRKKMPGSGEEQQVDGLWAGGAVGAIAACLGDYLLTVVDLPLGFVLQPGVHRTSVLGPPQFAPFISGAAPLVVYYQQTRRQFNGS